jgi:hypothetical protein
MEIIIVPTIHHAALPTLQRDFLSSSETSREVFDWIEQNAPGRFQRIVLLNAHDQPVDLLLVPAARWAAVAGDIAILEAERAEVPGLKAEKISAGIIERAKALA